MSTSSVHSKNNPRVQPILTIANENIERLESEIKYPCLFPNLDNIKEKKIKVLQKIAIYSSENPPTNAIRTEKDLKETLHISDEDCKILHQGDGYFFSSNATKSLNKIYKSVQKYPLELLEERINQLRKEKNSCLSLNPDDIKGKKIHILETLHDFMKVNPTAPLRDEFDLQLYGLTENEIDILHAGDGCLFLSNTTHMLNKLFKANKILFPDSNYTPEQNNKLFQFAVDKLDFEKIKNTTEQADLSTFTNEKKDNVLTYLLSKDRFDIVKYIFEQIKTKPQDLQVTLIHHLNNERQSPVFLATQKNDTQMAREMLLILRSQLPQNECDLLEVDIHLKEEQLSLNKEYDRKIKDINRKAEQEENRLQRVYNQAFIYDAGNLFTLFTDESDYARERRRDAYQKDLQDYIIASSQAKADFERQRIMLKKDYKATEKRLIDEANQKTFALQLQDNRKKHEELEKRHSIDEPSVPSQNAVYEEKDMHEFLIPPPPYEEVANK